MRRGVSQSLAVSPIPTPCGPAVWTRLTAPLPLVLAAPGGDNVTVVLRSGNAFEQHLVAQDRTDGTYLARFIRPNAAYDLDLVINGQTHDKVTSFPSFSFLPPLHKTMLGHWNTSDTRIRHYFHFFIHEKY